MSIFADMKKILTTLIAAALCFAANAQDIIVTNDGDAIKAYNLEMAGSSVFYQSKDDKDAPIQKISKADVLIIKMKDGTKIDPNAEPKASKEAEAAPALVDNTVKLSGDAAAKNASLIADFNRELTWEPDEKFLKKHQGKVGNGYTGIMWVSEDSQLHNGEITVSFQRGYNSELEQDKEVKFTDYNGNYFGYPLVLIKVKNNTDKMIYLDLANCFIMCGDESSPFYVPEVKTVTNTKSNASTSEYTQIKTENNKVKSSDHSYISGNSSTVTKVKEAQRYVSVAPKSTLSLDAQPICKNDYGKQEEMYMRYSWLYMNQSIFPFTNTPYGKILDIDEADSPFTFGSYISYSFSPDHSNPHSLQTEMYLRYVMCTSATSLFAYTIEGNFHKRYPFWIPFFVEKD